MNTVKIALCDDDSKHMSTVEKYLELCGEAPVVCDVYLSGEKLVAAYRNNVDERYDVVFLDMEMDGMNGIETANEIRRNDERVIIVFVTSHTEYMKESFQCQPFRFMEKPIDYDELKKVFHDVVKKLSERTIVFNFTENKTNVRLYCNDIIYCESQGHWAWICTKERTYKICKSLSELYNKLDKRLLFQVHKSFVVNFGYIHDIDGNNIRLYDCDKVIPISRTYKKAFIEEYTDFVERNPFYVNI